MISTPGVDTDERDPLLAVKPATPSGTTSVQPVTPNGRAAQQETPLPVKQLLILALVRLAEPINFTIIFPFVNQMMEDLKVTDKPSEIGFYSGLVDSSFAIAQCCTILQWGRLSDRIGRRPILFVGLTGSIISIFLFGMSQNLAWALSSRSIAGALSGNIAVIQTMLAELTDSTNESKAMPLVSVTWSIGIVLGPLLGGTLAHPAERWPASPLNNAWFRKYPYSLPCSVGALFGLGALIIAYNYLGETWKRSRHETQISRSSSVASSATLTEPEATAPVGVWAILSHPPLRQVLISGFLNSFLATAYDVVFALVCYSPIQLGGLSRTPAEIGFAFAFGGIISITLLPTGLPWLQRRYGTVPLYQFCAALWIVTFAGFPFLNLLARRFILEGSSPKTGIYILWLGIGSLVFISRITSMTFSLAITLVRRAAPDKRILGSTYGVSQTIACVARALGPACVSSLFALSVDKQIMGGNLVWVVMAATGMSCMLSSWRLTDLES
ncbi:hypothetical protein M408DRAFT_330004, partial [Serendipita vermifera MAFF 305830]